VRRTRLENLQRLTYGLLRGKSSCLSRIARFFPFQAMLSQGKGSWLWLALQLVEQAKPPELIRALRQAAHAGVLL
jgi:hypothetical protein